MRAWTAPEMPTLPVTAPVVQVHDTSRGDKIALRPNGPKARMYVCGITPYDATHLGHAATYIAFDLLNRAWRNAGHDVTFVQNVTDVDDPLLERAKRVKTDWVELAERETELFRADMSALRVLPPAHFVGAVESIDLVVEMVQELQAAGATYALESDIYYAITADHRFGTESGLDAETMLAYSAERGGDPDRAGKKHPLDPVVWRGERPDEPSWESPFGPGRPGWHIECAAIARRYLGVGFDVQGGGSDLVFPHHEMSAGHVQALVDEPFARAYVHAGMVAYDGQKMSKSLGNLVFVSALRNSDIDPMAIRLALLRHHYRSDWEWTDDELWRAVDDLALWRRAVSLGAGAPAVPVINDVLAALADDLDAPRATAIIDAWAAATVGEGGLADTTDADAARQIAVLADAALGIAL